jgi:hypothetical protein
MFPPSLSVRSTRIGRGVFAEKPFTVGEVIELAPTISDCKTKFTGRTSDYLFRHCNNPNCSVVAFGYASMYNHSNNPSASWKHKPNDTMEVTALCDIKKGDEIFVSYGDKYWKSRGVKPK